MGSDRIVDKTLKAFLYGGCWDSSGPSAIIATEPIRKALEELKEKNNHNPPPISTRIISSIVNDGKRWTGQELRYQSNE
jgi:hypothetical protein